MRYININKVKDSLKETDFDTTLKTFDLKPWQLSELLSLPPKKIMAVPGTRKKREQKPSLLRGTIQASPSEVALLYGPLTAKELALRFGVAVPTVHRYIKKYGITKNLSYKNVVR